MTDTNEQEDTQVRARAIVIPQGEVSPARVIDALVALAEAADYATAHATARDLREQLGTQIAAFEPLIDAMLVQVRKTDELRRLSRTDPLTGVANRSAFYDSLRRELARQRRDGGHTSVVMLDLDGLKAINDELGHEFGDRAIKAVARCCRVVIRASDHVGRLGGDEFAVLLPATDAARAAVIAERLRTTVQRQRVAGRRLAVSVGVATTTDPRVTPSELLRSSDMDLYKDKRSRQSHAA